MKKTYRVDIVNRRNHRVIPNGLPSFDRYEFFNSVSEAAAAIYERAQDVIIGKVAEGMGEMESEEEWTAEHTTRMLAVLDEINDCRGWCCDGIHYVILEEDVGRVYRSSLLSADCRTICDPWPIAPLEEEPFPRNEASLIISDYCRATFPDYELEESPCGWTCEYKNDAGNYERVWFSWIADGDPTLHMVPPPAPRVGF